ncbi:MAG TPA: ATP-binding protein [Stellaceae bacterium]|nr:ATP-binding protein [Stellaceae bacterium]
MKARILSVVLERETDIVLARQRTRKIAALAGFDAHDQTRITTALSEIARNAWEYGRGGRVEYWITGEAPMQALEIVVEDQGGGIADVESILSGAYRSGTGMGLGILGARRLMDRFEIDTGPGRGTVVRMAKALPRQATVLKKKDMTAFVQSLTVHDPLDPLDEIRRQNQDMLLQLEELNKREQALLQLNQELQDTNRGVVALYAELDERADHLRRADELKSRFLSNMSHEFRTPLNSILALSRLLLSRSDGELTAEQERQIHFMRKSAENLTELVNDLLDLAKVEAGKTVVTPVEFTAGSLFGALRGMLRPLLVGDAVALVFEDPSDIPELFTDEGKVSQILRNFLSNAIKFTERGEVRIWAEADIATDTVTFAVRDTGIGIAEDQMDVIWQEFGQVRNPLQSKVKGTGLGLPLSRKLAELLGGSVRVQSELGRGSVFSVTVPRIYLQPHDGSDSEIPWELEPGRVPVLTVEDNPADAFACERALAGSAYQPLPARSIAEAKRALERFTPAAVLLDIVLAGEDSWRFLIEMKHRPLTEHIPVIVISSSQDERKARSLGADDYLNKPIDAAMLVQALGDLTGGQSVTKVLAVDDEEVSRYLVRQLLPRGAFALSEASNGPDGLQRAQDERPDVVLLDLKMPGMDGFEFLDRLAQIDEMRPVPAIVITSMRLGAEDRRRLGRATQIVAKSDLSADLLVSVIRHAIESRNMSTIA